MSKDEVGDLLRQALDRWDEEINDAYARGLRDGQADVPVSEHVRYFANWWDKVHPDVRTEIDSRWAWLSVHMSRMADEVRNRPVPAPKPS